MAMFLGFLGRNRKPETLSQRDWDRFIRARPLPASWESPVAMSAISVYLVRNLANSPTVPEMLPDAPFRKTRARPDGPAFYGDTEVPRQAS